MSEIKTALDDLQKDWSEFKRTNEQRLAEVEKRGAAHPETEQKLKAISESMDALKAKADEAHANEEKLRKSLDDAHANIEKLTVLGGEKGDGLTLEQREYKTALLQYVRKGDTHGLDAKAMSVGSDPDGGYLVTPDMSGRIVSKVFETSNIRAIASVQTIGTDALEGKTDLDEADAGWVSETGARPATGTPQVGKWRIPVHELYAMPEATQKLLDDASVDVGAWLEGKISAKFSRVEETAFVSGDGAGKPRGIFSYTTAATADSARTWGVLEHVLTGSDGTFGTDPNGIEKLLTLIGALKPHFLPGARFLMNRTTQTEVRTLTDASSAGKFVFVPSFQAGVPNTLLGYPISIADDMASFSTHDSLAVAFGNFSAGYQIVDRQGIRVLRDPYTNKPYVRFYATKRVGGDVIDFEAIKFLKFGD